MKKSKSKFGTRQHMLDTLHKSYRYTLDKVTEDVKVQLMIEEAEGYWVGRLTDKEKRQLGRDLAKYRDISK